MCSGEPLTLGDLEDGNADAARATSKLAVEAPSRNSRAQRQFVQPVAAINFVAKFSWQWYACGHLLIPIYVVLDIVPQVIVALHLVEGGLCRPPELVGNRERYPRHPG